MSFGLSALLLATACGGEDPADDLGTEHIGDHDTLAQCLAPSSCEEGLSYALETAPDILSNMACLLTGLRDRPPGSYAMSREHIWTNGFNRMNLTLVVTPSGDAEIGWQRRSQTQVESSPVFTERYSPTMRCALKPAAYFDECIALTEDGPVGSSVPECIYGDDDTQVPWFDNCVEQSPACQ